MSPRHRHHLARSYALGRVVILARTSRLLSVHSVKSGRSGLGHGTRRLQLWRDATALCLLGRVVAFPVFSVLPHCEALHVQSLRRIAFHSEGERELPSLVRPLPCSTARVSFWANGGKVGPFFGGWTEVDGGRGCRADEFRC